MLGNPTQTFIEVMDLLLQLIEKFQIKSKTVMTLGARERKKCFLVIFILSQIFFIIYVFSQCIAYWTNSMISYLTAATQPLDSQNIWHCALTLLIKETRNFWSPSFLVFLACKHEQLLFQKRGDLVLH